MNRMRTTFRFYQTLEKRAGPSTLGFFIRRLLRATLNGLVMTSMSGILNSLIYLSLMPACTRYADTNLLRECSIFILSINRRM